MPVPGSAESSASCLGGQEPTRAPSHMLTNSGTNSRLYETRATRTAVPSDLYRSHRVLQRHFQPVPSFRTLS